MSAPSTISDPLRSRKKLLAWFRSRGRSLPWRETRDPYAVAVSEFMLQQTTVAAVIPYFRRWMGRFPDARSLAAASESEVLGLWQGLGYYTRARNLLAAARAVVAGHGGRFPGDPRALRALPGFGPYTAAVVAAFAFDLPEPPIDANIARVLARLGDVREPVDRPAGRAALDSLARALAPRHRGGRAFFSALMDLGATICKPGKPDCPHCPLRDECLAGNPAALPVKRPRPQTEMRGETRALVLCCGKIGLQLSGGPRWRGLWLLPEWPGPGRAALTLTYPITRFRVRMRVVEVSTKSGVFPDLSYYSPGTLPPMPSPHLRAVEKILGKSGDR